MNIKEALLELREEALSGIIKCEYCGIRFNLYTKLPQENDAYDFVEEYSVDWEHYSGVPSYPVPRTVGMYWEGVNLGLRISLIDHLLAKV